MVFMMCWTFLTWIGINEETPNTEIVENLSLNAPATTGAFYFFNQHHKPLNQPLIPGTIAM